MRKLQIPRVKNFCKWIILFNVTFLLLTACNKPTKNEDNRVHYHVEVLSSEPTRMSIVYNDIDGDHQVDIKDTVWCKWVTIAPNERLASLMVVPQYSTQDDPQTLEELWMSFLYPKEDPTIKGCIGYRDQWIHDYSKKAILISLIMEH